MDSNRRDCDAVSRCNLAIVLVGAYHLPSGASLGYRSPRNPLEFPRARDSFSRDRRFGYSQANVDIRPLNTRERLVYRAH